VDGWLCRDRPVTRVDLIQGYMLLYESMLDSVLQSVSASRVAWLKLKLAVLAIVFLHQVGLWHPLRPDWSSALLLGSDYTSKASIFGIQSMVSELEYILGPV